MKIRPKEALLFHADGRTYGWTDGHTGITKLIVAFRSFAKAPKTGKLVLLYAMTMPPREVILTNKLHWIMGSTKSSAFLF
jgi:hypothetical protein